MNSKNKNITELCREINEFKKCYQTRSNLVKDKNDLTADSHNILNRWMNYILLLSAQGVCVVRHTHIQIDIIRDRHTTNNQKETKHTLLCQLCFYSSRVVSLHVSTLFLGYPKTYTILFSFWIASFINMNSYCLCDILHWQLYLNF
jgi:hypothetical protein